MSKNALIAAAQEGLEALRSGRRLRRTTVRVEPPPKYTAAQILANRKDKIRASQMSFAGYLGVSTSTVRAWEQRQGRPSLLARRLLQLADRRPEALLELAGA